MDIYSYYHSKEGVALFAADLHIVQVIVVENPVIDSFGRGSGLVYFLPFFRPAWNGREETDIPIRFCVDDSSIFGRGAGLFKGARFYGATSGGATPFETGTAFTKAVINHLLHARAEWNPVFCKRNRWWECLWMPPVRVKVNKWDNSPCLTQFIGWIIVICGIQTKVFHREIG